jgi:hypothetical protein
MSRMRAHLDSGCDECTGLCRLWQTVSEIANQQSFDEPDESVLKAVKNAYVDRIWQPLPQNESWFATLVFDSFKAAAATAAVRSISSAARHLVYRSGQLTVDLWLDPYSDTSMMIAGQVLEAAAERTSVGRGEVNLVRSNTIVARTSTNEFGEFQLECDKGPDLGIRLEISGHQSFTLTLPE